MTLSWYNGFSPEERMEGGRIIKQAIRDGIIPDERLMKCERCGQDKGIRVYHCEDYSPDKILGNLTCLCWRCHMQIHSKYKNSYEWRKYEEDINNGKRYPPVYNKYWTRKYEKNALRKQHDNTGTQRHLDEYI